jgi:hypothetical protein
MTDYSDIRLSDAYETDLPEIVDYRTLEYNRSYFADKEAREAEANQSSNPRGISKSSKEARHSNDKQTSEAVTAEQKHRRSSRSPSKSSRHTQTQPSNKDTQITIPTAPPSEDAEEEPHAAVRYSVKELVATIGSQEEVSKLPAELQRRVMDFRLAQQKRREKYGRQQKWGT